MTVGNSALKSDLGPGERLVVATLLLGIAAVLIRFLSGSWAYLNDGSGYNLIFISAALLLVLGAYVSEPFFTRPADAIANALALIVALLGIREPSRFVGYWFIMTGALALLVIAILVVVPPRGKLPRVRAVLYRIVTSVGRSTYLFPILYILALASFFMEKPTEFWAMFTLLIILVARRPLERLVLGASSLLKSSRTRQAKIVGQIVGRLSPRLVAVHRSSGAWVRPGQLVEIPAFGGLSMYGLARYDLHRASGVDTVVEILAEATDARSLDASGVPHVLPLATPLVGDVLEATDRATAFFGTERDNQRLVGFVGPDSRMEALEVEVPESFAPRPDLKIGSVVTVDIRDRPHLYQVIAARTEEERIGGGDARGYLRFSAQPLGQYDTRTREMAPPTWIPEIYSPVDLCPREDGVVPADAIGRLPDTSIPVAILAPNELVTHNTAVLGVLGVGKSSLTFELVQKLVRMTDVRVVCIDVTNEYGAVLPKYISDDIVTDDVHAFDSINGSYNNIVENNAGASGNIGSYQRAIADDLRAFLFSNPASPGQSVDGAARVRVYNPDYHKVSRGEKVGFHVNVVEATQAEKTRVIAEQLFWIVQSLGPSEGMARVLLVLEEAHSLVPEWNAAAHDTDRSAANGTAKVILQGRKYGLGCLVIAQRTASVSKSILNQCNTVFAMRIFDDTGKQFLENYVGRSFADALPTLEERHAVAVGRGLRAKRPLIVGLNDIREVRIAP